MRLPGNTNERGEHLLSLVTALHAGQNAARVFSTKEDSFPPSGMRSVSKRHATDRISGIFPASAKPPSSMCRGNPTLALFGGNSNWRGPVWMPTNYLLVQAIEKIHRYLGDAFTFPAPCLNDYEINLNTQPHYWRSGLRIFFAAMNLT